MTISNLAMLDANILIYAHQSLAEFHTQSRLLLEQGLKGKTSLCICPQVLSEFYAVVTDPKRVTKPTPAGKAITEIEKYFGAKNILKIYPKLETIEKMINLLKRYGVIKQKIFDLQIVATMLANNITRIYTYNQSDFTKFTEIEALKP